MDREALIATLLIFLCVFFWCFIPKKYQNTASCCTPETNIMYQLYLKKSKVEVKVSDQHHTCVLSHSVMSSSLQPHGL